MQQPASPRPVHTTEDVVLAFAAFGISITTIARALAAERDRVTRICQRGIQKGTIQRMPPLVALTPGERRDALLTEVVHLREKLLDAQDRIRDLTSQNSDMSDKLWAAFGLTWSEAIMLAMLMQHEQCSKSRLFLALYGDDVDCEVEPKILDVFMCKMRKKLERHGVFVETIWGAGWKLTNGNKARITAIIGDNVEAVPAIESPPLQANQQDMVRV